MRHDNLVRSILAAALTGVLVVSGEALAHHSRGNRYDCDTEIAIQGSVRELIWRKPHIAIERYREGAY